MTDTEQIPRDINDTLNEFYKLKDKYEKNYYEKYIKNIVRSTNKSNKEKKKEFSRLPKPQCINCERNVGTIFSINGIEQDSIRNFIVKCGDIVDPCPLDINFNYSDRVTYQSDIRFTTKLLNKLKNKMVKEKNDVIFGYILPNIATELFNELSEELKENTDLNGFLIEKNILVNDNPAKKELVNKLDVELQNNNIVPFKNFISEYMRTDNTDYVKEAVQMYVAEIIPKLKEIQSLKYDVNFVEYNSDDNTFHLIQKPNSLENLQYEITDDDKIISYTKGVKRTKTSSKTLKASKSPKTKTLKIRPIIEVVDDEKYAMWEDEKAKLEKRSLLRKDLVRLEELKQKAEEEVAKTKDLLRKVKEDEYVDPEEFEQAEKILGEKIEELDKIKYEIRLKMEENANMEEERRMQVESRERRLLAREDEGARNMEQAYKARQDFAKMQKKEAEYVEKEYLRRYEVPNILEGIIYNVLEGTKDKNE